MQSLTAMEAIKQQIRGYLDVAGDGTFAASGVLPAAVNPGLFIEGLGKVGLPLTERDAKSMVEISHAGGIDAAQIAFRNPQWSSTLQQAVWQTVEQLGVLGGKSAVRADLLKLCLRDKASSHHTSQQRKTTRKVRDARYHATVRTRWW